MTVFKGDGLTIKWEGGADRATSIDAFFDRLSEAYASEETEGFHVRDVLRVIKEKTGLEIRAECWTVVALDENPEECRWEFMHRAGETFSLTQAALQKLKLKEVVDLVIERLQLWSSVPGGTLSFEDGDIPVGILQDFISAQTELMKAKNGSGLCFDVLNDSFGGGAVLVAKYRIPADT